MRRVQRFLYLAILFLFYCCSLAAVAAQAGKYDEHASPAPLGMDSLPDAPSAVAAGLQTRQLAEPLELPLFGDGMQGLNTPRVHLSRSDKFRLFRQRVFSTPVLAGALFDTAQAYFRRDSSGYAKGGKGLASRCGINMLDRTTHNFFGTFLLPSIFHQDPRYFRLGPKHSIWQRAEYAVTRVAIANNDQGGESFNASLVFSTVASKAFENLYYPRQRRGFGQTLDRIRGSLLGSAQDNLSREFLPDIEGFCRHHVPNRVRRVIAHLPFAHRWQPQDS